MKHAIEPHFLDISISNFHNFLILSRNSYPQLGTSEGKKRAVVSTPGKWVKRQSWATTQGTHLASRGYDDRFKETATKATAEKLIETL